MPSPLTKLTGAAANFSRSRAGLNETTGMPVPKLLTKSVHEVERISRTGPPFSLSDLPAYIDAVKNMNGVGLDDRKFLLEKLLTLMSRLPKDSRLGKTIEQYAIGLLYRDLSHPPGPYLALPPTGPIPYPQPAGVYYAYRPADGSYYNILAPSLGKAGMPYARSVPTSTTTPLSHLPDAATVFDTLLRRDRFVSHPGGLSSLFFAFADLIIHSIFDTSHADWSVNNASSYLDLSILYGSSEKQVGSVRRLDGSGKIWNDVFADSRLLLMPPSVCALLIIFSRNHNYVADKILSINERSTFSPLPLADSAARTAQDDEIFHRARLVNTGFFMQAILRDYVGVILGMVRDGSTWRLDPLEVARDSDHSLTPRGEGNAVSIEFNLLYRWHASISQQDTAWTEQVFKKLFPGKEWDQITVADFQAAAGKMRPGPDVKAWTFGDLERGPDGSFKDADVANFLHNATESAASAFKARGIPGVLRVIEIMGIEQGRTWGACSLNEFRKFVGLRPYESFEEWNPDPEIHRAAANLYQDIDHLELHVGLQAEEPKSPMPGAGLCPGYTISRAILSDAVCLTRGDRFMTTEFTPFNLTVWGYNDCKFDENDGSFGGMLSTLLFRHLPEYYPPGSAYGHFPFMVPETMRGYISGQGCSEDDYTWTRPTKAPLGLGTIEDRMQKLVRYPLVSVKEPLFSSKAVDHAASSFFHITKRLIQERFVSDVDSTMRHLNIVGDVVNLVPVYWVAEEIMDLCIKSATDSTGDVDPKDVYSAFSEVADYIFVNIEHSRDWGLHKASAETVRKFSLLIQVLLRNSADGLLNALKRFVKFRPSYPDHEALMKCLSGVFGQPQSVAASVLMETAATAALFSKAVALVVDYIFNNSKAKDVHNYLHPKNEKGDGEVISLIREALHLQDLGSYWDEQVLGVRSTESPLENYGLMNPSFFEKTTVEILRAVFTREDVVKRPNQPNNMGSFSNQIAKGHTIQSYLDDQGSVTPWPTTLIIHFDGHHSSA